MEQRGNSPRNYKNCLVFVAADETRIKDLDEAARLYLAWKSIEEEREELNLDAFQSKQARTKRDETDRTVDQRIPETYQWVIGPTQHLRKDGTPAAPSVDWEAMRIQGQDAPAVKASRKLVDQELLFTGMAGTRLRLELDRIPLTRAPPVTMKFNSQPKAAPLHLLIMLSPVG